MASERAIALLMAAWVLVIGGVFVVGMVVNAFRKERS